MSFSPVTEFIKRFCPHGHELTIAKYVWGHFLFHRCRSCKKLYNYNELTEES